MVLNPRLALMLSVPPLLWAGNAVVGRIAIQSIHPLWLNALRWAIALALAGVAVVLARGDPAALLRVQLVPGDVLMLVAIACWCAQVRSA